MIQSTYDRNKVALAAPVHGRGSEKAVETFFEIPGVTRPGRDPMAPTHVRVTTARDKAGYITCRCIPYRKNHRFRPPSFDLIQPWEDRCLAQEKARGTAPVMIRVHRNGLASLEARFPELFTPAKRIPAPRP